MNALIQQLIAQTGVTQGQAEGGAGLLFQLARDKLSGGDFAALTSAVPDLSQLLGAAPAAGGGGGGLLGAVGGLASALGGGKLGALAELAGGFSKLGLSADMVQQFVPVVVEYLQKNGSGQAVDILKKLLG